MCSIIFSGIRRKLGWDSRCVRLVGEQLLHVAAGWEISPWRLVIGHQSKFGNICAKDFLGRICSPSADHKRLSSVLVCDIPDSGLSAVLRSRRQSDSHETNAIENARAKM